MQGLEESRPPAAEVRQEPPPVRPVFVDEDQLAPETVKESAATFEAPEEEASQKIIAASARPTPSIAPAAAMAMPEVPRHEDAYEIKRRTFPQAIEELRKDLGADLVSKKAQQKAFILQELLGAPLALRGYGFEPIGLRPLNRMTRRRK